MVNYFFEDVKGLYEIVNHKLKCPLFSSN